MVVRGPCLESLSLVAAMRAPCRVLAQLFCFSSVGAAPFRGDLLRLDCLTAGIAAAAAREPSRDHHLGKFRGCPQ